MKTKQIKFSIPDDLTDNIGALSHFAFQSFIMRLYIEGEISLGKAAKLMKMSDDEFIEFLGKRGVPYFRQSPKEIEKALKKIESL